MITKNEVSLVLQALSDAGLCVCESDLIQAHHPGLLDDDNYIIGRLEESGASMALD